MYSLRVLVWLCCVGVALSQYQQGGRVAPGVPPQQYVPPPHGQVPQHGQIPQHGQVPQHGHVPQHAQQHVPQQFQQVPQQQHVPQQQIHQQQVPQQQQQQVAAGHNIPSHGHNHGHDPNKFMDATNVLQERAHIQEHMDVPIDTSQMSEQELQFHYFKMHDADNNNKLDGCELVKSLIHWHDQSNHDPRSGHAIPEPKIFKDEELIQMIDPILNNDDKNLDGMIDYMEFSLAQANAAARGNAAGAGVPTTH